MTRRLLAVALSALLLAAGCSDGGSPKATTSPTPSPTPLTATQAKTVATAGILTAADLPGYTAKPAEADPDHEKTAADISRCAGQAHSPYLVIEPGTDFTKGPLEVTSSIDIAASSAAAAADFAAYDSNKGAECAKSLFRSAIEKEGLTVSSIELTRAEITVPKAEKAFGYSLKVAASAPDGTAFTMHGYTLGALLGQAEIALNVLSVDVAPTITLQEASALLAKSVERVDAAS